MITISRALAALAVLAASTGTAACSSTVSGRGAVLAQASPAPSPSTTPSGGSAGQLAARLMPPPARSEPWHSAWAHNRTPSVRQFAVMDYAPADVDSQVALLRAQGIRYIAHQAWFAADLNQADMILLQFASVNGARSRYLSATSAKRDARGIRSFAVPGVPGGVAYYHPTLDRLGNVVAIAYAQVRDVVVEEFYYTPAHMRTKDAIAWLRTQVAHLG